MYNHIVSSGSLAEYESLEMLGCLARDGAFNLSRSQRRLSGRMVESMRVSMAPDNGRVAWSLTPLEQSFAEFLGELYLAYGADNHTQQAMM